MNLPSGYSAKVYVWLNERLPLDAVKEYLSKKTVPQHKHSMWYYFGGLTLFFFVVQLVTGILLSLYYKPTPEHAYESVKLIITQVEYGWLIRSLHSWSANLMIAMLFIHMFSAFLMKAYRKPRELMWVTGVLLLFLVLGFGFTGYLLPWDTMAYFATLIGTEVPKTMPLIGSYGVGLLKGGEEIGAETLTRMYSIHIIILPLLTIVIISLHVILNQVLGSSIPVGIKEARKPLTFFPNFLYRDLISWCLGFIALLTLATMYPWSIGDKADPLASAPVGIKPEWYFLPLYQTLRIVPSSVVGINGELLVNGVVGLASLLWLMIPFVDFRSRKEQKSSIFTAIGILLILYLVAMIILASTT